MQRLNWKPAQAPRRVAIEGKTVRLEPLEASRHADDLFKNTAGADSTWGYLAYGPFPSRDEFTKWLETRAPLDDPLTFTIIDRAAGEARGLESLMRIDAPNGVIEIGHIWLSPRLQRTRQATEAIYLLSRYVFDDLGYRRYEWKCDSLNQPSRRAAERYGFVFEGIFRQHMVVKDRNRDTAWYSILDGEWPSCRAAFEAWLADDNFDAAGQQKRSLAELRRGIEAHEVR
ncbi:MAG TPA: GNAT family protein [Candidatus Dormibacteraeota bacterium]|nr:GNAT family protein [Candidatus Dormibacteraeota bacterium]